MERLRRHLYPTPPEQDRRARDHTGRRAPQAGYHAAKASRGNATTILVTSEGTPWTGDGFRSSWRKACIKAGVTDLTFHDLRGSAITRLAIAGATVPEIATISGLSLGDVRILDKHYLKADVALAENAIRKLEGRAPRK
jgi:integrase